MVNGYRNKHIYWIWQCYDGDSFQIGHSSSCKGCWMWNPKYGSDGAIKWKNRNSGKIMICCNRSKLKYTYAFNLFVINCKKKLGEKFFARNFKLVSHIISKKNIVNRIDCYNYLLSKYNINYDVINCISEYTEENSRDIKNLLKYYN